MDEVLGGIYFVAIIGLQLFRNSSTFSLKFNVHWLPLIVRNLSWAAAPGYDFKCTNEIQQIQKLSRLLHLTKLVANSNNDAKLNGEYDGSLADDSIVWQEKREWIFRGVLRARYDR